MVRLRIFFYSCFLLYGGSIALAQRNVVDFKTILRLGENTATQIGLENEHNETLDSISSKQQRLAASTMTIMLGRENHLKSRTRVDEFSVESTFYKQAAALAVNITAQAPAVIQKIKKAPLAGKARMLLEVENLITACIQLTNDFRNIVTNCKVKPILGSGNTNDQSDGYNILDRDERIGLALKIISRLSRINNRLTEMGYYADYCSWSNVMYAIDRDSWCRLNYGSTIANSLINQWNGL